MTWREMGTRQRKKKESKLLCLWPWLSEAIRDPTWMLMSRSGGGVGEGGDESEQTSIPDPLSLV